MAWSRHARLLTGAKGHDLIAAAQRRPRDAEDVLQQAIIVREAIYHVFLAIAHGEHPSPCDLATVNAAFPPPRVVERATGFGWGWLHEPDALAQMLWSVAWSAADLLIHGEPSRVKECAAGCGWLFLDRSKNGSRQYCNPVVCGNRVRARRHYAHRRSTAEGTTGGSRS